MKKIEATLLTRDTLPPSEAANVCAWSQQPHLNNDFDAEVLLYPRTVICKASDGAPLAYVPVHPVLMFESIAPRPGITSLQVAQSLLAITDLVDKAARETGHKETYCLTSSADEVKLAVRRGWTVVLHDPDKQRWMIKRKVT